MKQILKDGLTVGLEMTEEEFDEIRPEAKRTLPGNQREVFYIRSGVKSAPVFNKPVFVPVTIIEHD
ncbi:MAG: hypothetical protein WC517_01405 [Patescibacteria group bacterium]